MSSHFTLWKVLLQVLTCTSIGVAHDVRNVFVYIGNKSLIECQKGKNSSQGDTSGNTSSGALVSFNGAMVNVDSVVSNLSKSERSRIEMEQQLKTIETDCGRSLRSVEDLFLCSPSFIGVVRKWRKWHERQT